MLLGVPVVASNTGGIPSMIVREKEGLLFEKGNITELAKSIMRTWEEDAKVDVMNENAIVRARKTHDADENNRTLLEIYRDIIHD